VVVAPTAGLLGRADQAQTNAGTIVQEVFPSSILLHADNGHRYYGLEAERHFAQMGPSSKHVFIPSIKRQLRDYSEGKDHTGQTSSSPGPSVADLLTEFLKALNDSIRRSASRRTAGDGHYLAG
jgi:hypothetical protein